MTGKKITKIIGLLRLSKAKKGKTKGETANEAYGIEHQRSEIQRIANQEGAEIIGWYTDIETGTFKGLKKRGEMMKAIQQTKARGAVLVIGKLDRLARNVHFISGLMEAGVDFICCDNPNATRLTIHILSAVAEDEAVRISERTKNALAAAKNRGVKLGSAREGHWLGREHLRGTEAGNAASAKARTERAVDAYQYIMPLIRKMREDDAPLSHIAAELNLQNYVTTRGKPFTKVAVHRVIKLFEREKIVA